MKPAQEYSTRNIRALWEADIDPVLCGGLVCRAKRYGLPGWEDAVRYLKILQKDFPDGEHQPIELLSAWTPMASNPFKNIKQREELQGKSLSSHLGFEKSLLELIRRQESNEGWPEGIHPGRKLLKKDGKISPDALAEVLRSCDPSCPASANKMIAKALKS